MPTILADTFVAGVDEAGRGPLAGPVVAGAVILDPDKPISGLTDSKLLTEKKREVLYDKIFERALAVGVACAEPFEIDSLNILQASMLAMRRAVLALRVKPTQVLVDGNRCPSLPYPCQAIIQGDRLEQCISAGSIIAKVTRDRLMLRYHERYPVYGFDQHKGYPTRAHREALQAHGACWLHRRSFAPVKNTLSA